MVRRTSKTVVLAFTILFLSCSGSNEGDVAAGVTLHPSAPECGDIPEGSTSMAYLPTPGFCIDRTEVTRGQYERWLASGSPVDKDALPADCHWKNNFDPPADCMAHENVCRTDCTNQPMVCVDWCDAHAYCNAMGKRLCGAINGAETPYDDGMDPAASQWMAACTSNGLYDYPYGDEFDPTACNGAEMQPEVCVTEALCKPRDVATLPLCHGPDAPFDGIYDLSGNVSEWEDSCDWTFTGHCRHRGGSSYPDHAYWTGLRCDFDSYSLARFTSFNYHHFDIGFRCCKDVPGG